MNKGWRALLSGKKKPAALPAKTAPLVVIEGPGIGDGASERYGMPLRSVHPLWAVRFGPCSLFRWGDSAPIPHFWNCAALPEIVYPSSKVLKPLVNTVQPLTAPCDPCGTAACIPVV